MLNSSSRLRRRGCAVLWLDQQTQPQTAALLAMGFLTRFFWVGSFNSVKCSSWTCWLICGASWGYGQPAAPQAWLTSEENRVRVQTNVFFRHRQLSWRRSLQWSLCRGMMSSSLLEQGVYKRPVFYTFRWSSFAWWVVLQHNVNYVLD